MQQPKLFTTPTAVNQPHPTKPGLLPTWVSEQLEQNKEHAAARGTESLDATTINTLVRYAPGTDDLTITTTAHASPRRTRE